MNTEGKGGPKDWLGRIVVIFVSGALLTAGFLMGSIVYGRGEPPPIITPGGIELRYDQSTGWFEIWENGNLAAEFTATELHIESVADPRSP